MDCPYCLGEIDTRAVVCKHCGRDVGFIRPLQKRIETLERTVETLRTSISTLARSADPAERPVDGGGERRVSDAGHWLYVAVTTAFAAVLLYMVGFEGYIPIPWGIGAGTVMSVLGGMAVSLRATPTIPRTLLAGVVFGLLSGPGTLFYFTVFGGGSVDVTDLLLALGIYLVGGVLGWTTGAFIARWFGGRRRLTDAKQSLGQDVAVRVLRVEAQADPEVTNRRVERATKLIEAIGPIITATITALTTYMAIRLTGSAP